jgi:hypothetical protein
MSEIYDYLLSMPADAARGYFDGQPGHPVVDDGGYAALDPARLSPVTEEAAMRAFNDKMLDEVFEDPASRGNVCSGSMPEVTTFFAPNEHPEDAPLGIVAANDPGEFEALHPVLAELSGRMRLVFMATGPAAESYRRAHPDHISQGGYVSARASLRAANVREPNVIITGIASDSSLQIALAAEHPRVPWVAVDDSHTAGPVLIKALRGTDVPMPIMCVPDVDAQQALLAGYSDTVPNLASRLVVTGQPAFDYVAERRQDGGYRQAAREALAVTEDGLVISCFSTINALAQVKRLAPHLATMPGLPHLILRTHSRDPVPYEDYAKACRQAGVKLQDTSHMTFGEVLDASDLTIVVPDSTIAWHAIMRRIPTVHILPEEYPELPMSVRRGASVGATANGLVPVAVDLLAQRATSQALPSSQRPVNRWDHMLQAMNHAYPLVGGAAGRVAQVVMNAIADSR